MKKHLVVILFFAGVLMSAPALAITLLTPNGGEQWRANTSKKITWSTTITGTVKLEYQTSSGGVWNLISSGITAQNQSYDWLVPAVESATCLVKVTNLADELDFDESDTVFTITQSVPAAEAEPNNTAYVGNWIEYGDSLTAAISPLGDVDYYRFWGAAGDTVEIWGHHRNDSQLGGRIILYQANGTSLTTNNGYLNPPMDQRIVWILPLDGIYYIRYAETDNWGTFPNRELVERLEQDEWEKRQIDPAEIQWVTTGDYYVGVRRLAPGGPAILIAESYDYYWNSVHFRGYVDTRLLSTTAQFDYGPTTSLGTVVLPVGGPFSGAFPVWIDSPIVEGLQSEHFYYMRMSASNSLGSTISGIREFLTLPPPEGWERKISGMKRTFNDVAFIDDNIGIIVGDSLLIRTANGGNTWTSLYSGAWVDFKGVVFASSTTGFALGSYGNALRTTDAGLTWTPINTGTGQYLFSGYFLNSQLGWLVGGAGTILHTTDGGQNWTPQNSGAGSSLRGVYFIDENVGMVVGYENTILRTTNGGTTWTPVTVGSVGSYRAIHFANALVGAIVGANDYILRTADGGLTWQQVSIPIEAYWEMKDVHFYEEGYGIAIGSMGTIFRTADGGLTWTRQQSGTMNNLFALDYAGTHTTIVGRNYAILRSEDFLSLKAPVGGELWRPDSTYNVVWWTSLTGNMRLDYRTSSASGWLPIVASTPAAAGSYAWTIPDISSDSCKVRITSLADGSYVDESDSVFAIHAPITVTQQIITLNAGWNMISSYIDPPDSTLPTLLGPLGSHLTIAKNNGGQVYWPAYGINTIGKWKPLQGYKCYLTELDTLVFSGDQLIPELVPITLPLGWNTVAYLRTSALLAPTALASLSGNLTIAKNMAGQVYWPLYGINTIGNLLPGQGYQLYVSAAETLIYPANSILPKGMLATCQTKRLQHFKVSSQATGSSAILLVKAPFLEDNDEMAVCGSDDQCLGAGVAQRGQVLVTIFGDDDLTKAIDGARDGEKLTLTWWSASAKTETPMQIATLLDGLSGSALTSDLCYQDNAIWVSTVADNMLLPKEFALRQNYPNPFNPTTNIRCDLPQDGKMRLVVYNLRGQVIRTLVDGERKAGYHDVVWDGRDQGGSLVSSGIYLAHMEAGSYVKVIKMSFIK